MNTRSNVKGIMNAIHSPKPMFKPIPPSSTAPLRYFIAIALGGVPIGVPIPPTLAATGIDNARPILPLPSAGSAFNTGARNASIIAAVAVLLKNIENTAVTVMKPSSTYFDCVPNGFNITFASITSRPVLVAAIAIMKPPMKSIMIGSAKQAINDL